MECRLAGETEVLGENLPQRHFCPTWPDPGLNPNRRGGKPATNHLSYGAALFLTLLKMRTMRSELLTASSIELQKFYQRVYQYMENSRFIMNQYD
jgi:hypothetical protein